MPQVDDAGIEVDIVARSGWFPSRESQCLAVMSNVGSRPGLAGCETHQWR
jgi:hypothetical protein